MGEGILLRADSSYRYPASPLNSPNLLLKIQENRACFVPNSFYCENWLLIDWRSRAYFWAGSSTASVRLFPLDFFNNHRIFEKLQSFPKPDAGAHIVYLQ